MLTTLLLQPLLVAKRAKAVQVRKAVKVAKVVKVRKAVKVVLANNYL
jgi:hypothetical protein